jgi:hypothetical protein
VLTSGVPFTEIHLNDWSANTVMITKLARLDIIRKQSSGFIC